MFGTSDLRVLRGVLSFSPSARSRSPQEMKKRKKTFKKKENQLQWLLFCKCFIYFFFPPFFFVLPFIFRQLTASFFPPPIQPPSCPPLLLVILIYTLFHKIREHFEVLIFLLPCFNFSPIWR
jgi:hypothetical protein